MQELFLVIFAHCSGGHGDTFSVKGAYFHFRTAMDVALSLSIGKEGLKMTSIDHGAYIYKLGLNKTYDAQNGEHCVFVLRYNPALGLTKTWFDEELKRSYYDGK